MTFKGDVGPYDGRIDLEKAKLPQEPELARIRRLEPVLAEGTAREPVTKALEVSTSGAFLMRRAFRA